MEIESMTGNRLMGRTMKVLQQVLDFRSANQSVIAGNMANIETPGYEPRKATFNQALRQAVEKNGVSHPNQVALRKTQEKHLPASSEAERPYTIDTYSAYSERPDLDREMAELAENNLLYEASVTLLSKKFQALKEVIAGRR
ncbi:MAG: flagellar basal body rod protein FlgB [Thermodesulfobacteriota bacterium]